ncbi:SHOCT domain-containing protein [Geminicoccus roseus]|uniref:SHOCT domain-containing protein n=1 Tax=Geminicoccus roseus TaxID=404900 RepID=UPI0003F80D3F|nr:SHOCT domain-containing protein [Geminicoccus roseus]
MQELTAEGRRVVGEVADRHDFSTEAVMTLLHALSAGNGTMAQFDHPELGGMGQWSQGGMVMIGDMFNNALKHRVDAACVDLARELEERPLFAPKEAPSPGPTQTQTQAQGGTHRAQAAGYGHGGSGASMVMSSGGKPSGNWWPTDLGSPSSTGSQNHLRYAYFPQSRRLALDVDGRITVYDTEDHQISGFSQQQGGDASIMLTSQHGLVRVADLTIVSPVHVPGPAHVPAPDHGSAPVFRPTPIGGTQDAPPPRTGQYVDPPTLAQPAASKAKEDEIFATIERLAGLKQKGILSDEEFAAKKAELLARL